MAGNEDREEISAVGAADGADGFCIAHVAGLLSVTAGFAERYCLEISPRPQFKISSGRQKRNTKRAARSVRIGFKLSAKFDQVFVVGTDNWAVHPLHARQC